MAYVSKPLQILSSSIGLGWNSMPSGGEISNVYNFEVCLGNISSKSNKNGLDRKASEKLNGSHHVDTQTHKNNCHCSTHV